jgi:hypothetical protein
MEEKLAELVSRLKAAVQDNLKAVVLYGSAASGEYRSGHSDLNILCLVERADSAVLERLHAPTEWWIRQGHPAPLVFTLGELQHSADIFAIELLDMKLSHRILHGEDFLATFEVPLHQHHLQVERELRTGWLRIREAVVAAPLSNKAHLGIMLESVSPFCTLFRHALMVLGQTMPATKREAVDAVASLTGGDPTAFRAILDLREGKRKKGDIDVEASLNAYLELVSVVTNEVDRRLDAS